MALKFSQVTCAAALVALLPGCGGLQTQPVPAARTASQAPASSLGDLLYVSDAGSGAVYIFTYPKGRLVGTLDLSPKIPQGVCADRSGDVFVTDQAEILEYAHGGTKPIKTLSDADLPIACTVDPTTGNLAVANEAGNVTLYPNATGAPTTYPVPFVPLFCAYDDSGNLFADSSGAPGIQIARLAKGADAFQKVAYSGHNNGRPAGLAWSGKYLAVGSASPYPRGCCGRIYQFSVSGMQAKRVGKTSIDGSIDNFFVEGSTAIVSTGFNRAVFYDYPTGRRTKVIKEPGVQSYGVVMSLAQSGPSRRR